MADGGGLQGASLVAVPAFNWVFLVELIVAGILVVFFLFYFDRLFAAVISYSIRPYIWKKYKVRVSIESLQISLLGGRIFAKGIRYHGKNETVYIQNGHLTWQYWLWSVRHVDLTTPPLAPGSSDGTGDGRRARSIGKVEAGQQDRGHKIPCRVFVWVQGLEWFVYNRSPAYDDVARQFGQRATRQQSATASSQSTRSTFAESTSYANDRQGDGNKEDGMHLKRRRSVRKSKFVEAPSMTESPPPEEVAQSDDSLLLKVLPATVECYTGSVIIGNPNTAGYLVASFQRAEGEVDAGRSRSTADHYKQMFNFDFFQLKAYFQGNHDYDGPQSSMYPRHLQRLNELQAPSRVHRSLATSFLPQWIPGLLKTKNKQREPHHGTDVSANLNSQQGSERGEETDGYAEYAKVSTLLDSPCMSMSFFWDSPGQVEARVSSAVEAAVSPEWGVELIVKGGSVNYGPWADRQRGMLQSIFAPRLYQDQSPAEAPKPGEPRQYDEFSILVELEENVTLRVPTKESSKDATWRRKFKRSAEDGFRSPGRKRKKKSKLTIPQNSSRPGLRPFGWIDIAIAANSTVRYNMAMTAGRSGFKNQLDLDLKAIEVTTSVNHRLMLRAKRLLLSSDLGTPLDWNALHSWAFKIEPSSLQLFLLRDHIFLLTDLISDWGSGPPADFFVFTPFLYQIDFAVNDISLLLNVNDGNVIDNPTSTEENTFLRFDSPLLDASVGISLRDLKPDQNEVTFDIGGKKVALYLDAPSWKTQNQFTDNNRLAKLDVLSVKGRYHYFSATDPSLTDTCVLDIDGRGLTLVLYGVLIKYFIRVKENYSGETMHFKTFEEFQQQLANMESEPAEKPPAPSSSNDLDVMLSIAGRDLTLILPSQIYTAGRAVICTAPELDLDLRFTNYYMDMQLSIVPIQISHSKSFDIAQKDLSALESSHLFLDGLQAYGHRLFGLPPTEPTYVCHWDFSVGILEGRCGVDLVHALMGTARSFVYGFKDAENLLPQITEVLIHDITFLRASVTGCDLALVHDRSTISAQLGCITITSNDWIRQQVSERQQIHITDAHISCIYDMQAPNQADSFQFGQTEVCGSMQTSCEIWRMEHRDHYEDHLTAQQHHIFESASRTGRMGQLLLNDSGDVGFASLIVPESFPAAMCCPEIPSDLVLDDLTSDTKEGLQQYPPSEARAPPDQPRSTAPEVEKRVRIARMMRSSSSTELLGNRRIQRLKRSQTSGAGTFESPTELANDHDRTGPGSLSEQFRTGGPFLGVQKPRSFKTNDLYQNRAKGNIDRPSFNPEFELGNRAFEENTSYQGIMILLQKTSTIEITPRLTQALTPILISIQEASSPDAESRTDEVILDELQSAVVSEAERLAHEPAHIGSCLEIFLTIPTIVLKASSVIASQDKSIPSACRSIAHLQGLTTRLRTQSRAPGGSSNPVEHPSRTLHFAVDTLSLNTQISCGPDRISEVANIELSDLLIWLMTGNVLSAHLKLGSSEVEFHRGMLSAIMDHVDGLISTQRSPMEALSAATEAQRLYKQAMVKRVAMHRTELRHAEPLLLNRTAFMVRFSYPHVRALEAWRMTMHLRHLLQMMQHQHLDHVEGTASGNRHGASSSLYDIDVPQLKQLLGRHGGPDPGDDALEAALKITPPTKTSKTPVVELQLLLSSFRVSLGSGPNSSDVALLALQIQLSTDVNKRAHIFDVGKAPAHTSEGIVLEVACDMITSKLTWEICEILEEVQPLVNKAGTGQQQSPSASKDAPFSQLTRTPIQAVVSVNMITCSLDSINVQMAIQTNAFRASLNIEESPEGISDAIPVAALLEAEYTALKLAGDSHPLAIFNLRRPRIHATSPGLEIGINPDPLWSLYGHCKKIEFQLKEEILNLLLHADQLLIDEVAQLYRLAHLGNKRKPVPEPSHEPLSKPDNAMISNDRHRVRIMLRLDSYEVGLVLLPSVAYRATGRSLRLSATSDLKLKDAAVDFDARSQLHEILFRQHQKLKVISTFHLPPVNGRIAIQFSDKAQVFHPRLSVDPIQIDLSSVQNLLHVINRPEILDVVEQAQKGIDNLISHSSQIFKHEDAADEEKGKSSTPSLALRYDGQFALAGFAIFADAADARLLINLGCVAAHVTNPPEGTTGAASLIPSAYVGIRRMVIDLQRINGREKTSCGQIIVDAQARLTSKLDDRGVFSRSLEIKNKTLDVQVLAETASTVVNIMNNLQDRVQNVDLSREMEYIHKFRERRLKSSAGLEKPDQPDLKASLVHETAYIFEMQNTRVSWLVGQDEQGAAETGDLVLSIRSIKFTKEKGESARLSISEMLLELSMSNEALSSRALNSALLPEVVFLIAYKEVDSVRRLGVRASGKSLDLRLTTLFIKPAQKLEASIATASQNVRNAAAKWKTTPTESGAARRSLLGNKRLASLLVDVSFAGAVVYLLGQQGGGSSRNQSIDLRGGMLPQHGRFGQVSTEDSSNSTTLRSPGVAFKVEYIDDGKNDPGLNAEIKIHASSNILYPTVVPLILEITNSIKHTLQSDDQKPAPKPAKSEEADPESDKEAQKDFQSTANAILGRTRLDIGFRICQQKFTLSCQPLARVAASVQFEDIYTTLTSVDGPTEGRFLALCTVLKSFEAGVQHVYSREATASFSIDRLTFSAINSKHLSGVTGVSAILHAGNMAAVMNARQLQDLFIFKEIWLPKEIRDISSSKTQPSEELAPQVYFAERYQQVANAGAFPWNAAISFSSTTVDIDLGQSLGKLGVSIEDLWISSRKDSNWEQNLCIGLSKIKIIAAGRINGEALYEDFRIRTSIRWPIESKGSSRVPLIEASAKFAKLTAKVGFDYQVFAVGDLGPFSFLMYNLRGTSGSDGDRLVATLDGSSIQVFCSTMSAARAVSLQQALTRLYEEKVAAYETALTDIDKYLNRLAKASVVEKDGRQRSPSPPASRPKKVKSMRLQAIENIQTDITVNLGTACFAAFPNSFSDNRVFKVEASHTMARFAVSYERGRNHSSLGMTLGRFQVALNNIKNAVDPKSGNDLNIDTLITAVGVSRGGTILKVPQVIAEMQTWQGSDESANQIDYTFKSAFNGKVDVGWNYSRISFIRGMWAAHTRNLAQRLGKPLPQQSAVQITGGPKADIHAIGDEPSASSHRSADEEKITAVINVPESKYEYHAMSPAIIDTPQLRDMGEATPPLEWIGLHREKLPNLTHQLIIVTLLEVTKEVEDAYSRILGSS